ncbi:MAG: site-specific integrase [Planctomycetaceae bacterium]|nr:site-specific integrase [Planctomycetaceae bacterium]
MFLIGEKKLAPSTIAKRLQRTRQMFAAMKRRRLIEENPFTDVKHGEGDVTGKQRFIGRGDTSKLIDAAPDWVWRAIIALARYGGLRCPSEVLSLKLADIDWGNARLRVTSPKTEHNPGGASRVIPIFPELRPFLDEVWEMAAEGEEYVIPSKYRTAALGADGWRNCNLRTQFLRIVKRAGLKPYPRPFHNLRASRETELAAAHPVHVAAEWLGNSPRIALKHYLQVTESDFAKAVANAESDLEIPMQYTAEMVRNTQQEKQGGSQVQKTTEAVSTQNCRDLRPLTFSCGKSLFGNDLRQMAGTGFEPATSRL